MPALLRPEGAGDIFAALHDLPALIIDTEDAGHTVPAGAAFQGRRYAFLISDGPGARACSSRKSSDKGLLLYPRLSLQRACYIMQVTHLVPLVGGECDLFLRTTLLPGFVIKVCIWRFCVAIRAPDTPSRSMPSLRWLI